MCLFSNSIKFHKTPKLVKIDELKLSIKNVTSRVRGVHRGCWGGQWPTDCYWPPQRTAPPPEVEIKTNITVNTSAAASWNWTQRSTSLYKHQDFHTVRNIQPCSHTMGHLKTLFFFLIHNQAVRVQIFLGELISDSKSVL